MRSIKRKNPVDHIKATTHDEKGLNERGKKHVLIKPKVEVDEGVNDSTRCKC